MFSRRTRWELATNRLAERVEERRRQGAPIIDLTQGNPTRCRFEYPSRLIVEALADPQALVYEPSPRGRLEARQAVSRYYASRGASVDPDRLVLTASTSEAYAFLFKLLADPGDRVLVPRPSYPLFEYLTGLESIGTTSYMLAWDGEWHVDLASVRQAIDGRTRALLAVSPNNPTGNFLKPEEREALDGLCRQHDLALIVDEVFADFRLDDAVDVPRALAQAGGALTFVLNGLSKVAGLPQIKAGWIVTAGPEDLVRPALERLEVIADTYLSVSTPIQVALPALLEGLAGVRSQIQARVKDNLTALCARSSGERPWRVLPPEGGWYAIIELPRVRTEEEWAVRLLEDDGVLVQPGYFFDMSREAFIVVSLLVPPSDFTEGVRRITERVEAEAG
jgi:aspartate/methionine/tyrosine aminotransferase